MLSKQIKGKLLDHNSTFKQKFKCLFNGPVYFFSQIVRLSYKDLTSHTDRSFIPQAIEKAFNKDGFGILIIQNVPEYYEAKINLFRDTYKLNNLPLSTLSRLERPEIKYSLGYSFGKEMFNDKPDIYKASYYVNIPKESTYTSTKNIWPNELPMLESNVYKLSNIIRNVGYQLLTEIDKYIKSKFNDYSLNYPEIIKNSEENTGRLLYYFPKNKVPSKGEEEDWCAWHNDHGSLTGLASACYIDSETGEIIKNIKSEKTGLYIQSRKAEVIKVDIGQEDVAFQLGETLQIHSGGLLHATPHAVKVYNDMPGNIARCTYALFMEPNRNCLLTLPKNCNLHDISTSEIYDVPKIQKRFNLGMNFGQFCDATNETFYKDNK